MFKYSENYDICFRCTKLYIHKIVKKAGNIHLLKVSGMLKAENEKLNKTYLWDTLEVDWKEVTVTFNDNKINLPKSGYN